MAFLLICAIFLVICAVALYRTDVVYNNYIIIMNAIKAYHTEQLSNEVEVDYDDLEGYMKTFYRFWDWGYSRILPPEKLEIIRPYIKEGEKNDD